MVITDELSNDTMLIQLRCKTNRKVKDRHAVEQKENKNQARKTLHLWKPQYTDF